MSPPIHSSTHPRIHSFRIAAVTCLLKKEFLKGKNITVKSLKQELKWSPESKVILSHFCFKTYGN